MQRTMKCRLCAIFLLVATLLGVFLCCLPLKVGAGAVRDASDVLADLKQDTSFNTDEFPVVQNSTSLEVIHFAESEQGELLVYVYQPHQTPGKYQASSINISATTDDSLDIKNYYLDMVDYDGVFQKYVVRGLSALTNSVREYEVVSIFRMFDKDVDEAPSEDNGNSINEVVYPVAKKYTLKNTPNGTTLGVVDMQYITITDKFVGFIRYEAGSVLFVDKDLDVHFVAFSASVAIDKLLEADVLYSQQSYVNHLGIRGESWGEIETGKRAYLTAGQNMTYEYGVWKSKEYSWNTIESSTDFVKSASLERLYRQGVFNDVYAKTKFDENALKEIENCQWVLRFAQTEYLAEFNGLVVASCAGTIISEVSILRLAFETDGKYYNLPVVDNKQTGSRDPVGYDVYEVEAKEWWQKIMMLLCLILLCVVVSVLWGPITLVCKVLGAGFLFILKALLWVLTMPFKLIARLFHGGGG